MLCLDGGGVKGIIETNTLEYMHFCLQQFTKGYSVTQTFDAFDDFLNDKGENVTYTYDQDGAPKMYKMFDVMVGTSMGAIISVAMARLHMSPDELKREVLEIATEIFPPNNFWNVPGHFARLLCAGFRDGRHRYSERPLENYLQEKLKNHSWSGIYNDPHFGIVATKAHDSSVHMFNSKLYNKSDTVQIWQAIRASTAAPVYFPSFYIEDDMTSENVEYIDGGLGANCPVSYAMQMLDENDSLSVLVSIGVGDSNPSHLPIARAFQHARNGEEEWEKFRASRGAHKSRTMHRLAPSISSGLGKYRMSDSSKVEEMQNVYRDWLKSSDSNWYRIELVSASASLFAKSLSVLEAAADTTCIGYKLKLKIHVKFDDSTHYGECYVDNGYFYPGINNCDSVTESEFKIHIKLSDNPIILNGLYEKPDNNGELIHIKFNDFEIAGSPMKIKKKFELRPKKFSLPSRRPRNASLR